MALLCHPSNSQPKVGDQDRTAAFHPAPQMLTSGKEQGWEKAEPFFLVFHGMHLQHHFSSPYNGNNWALWVLRFEEAPRSITFDGQSPGYILRCPVPFSV